MSPNGSGMMAIFRAGDLPRAQQCQEDSLMPPPPSHCQASPKLHSEGTAVLLSINFPKFKQTSGVSKGRAHDQFSIQINYCNLIEIKTRLKAKKKKQSQTNLS